MSISFWTKADIDARSARYTLEVPTGRVTWVLLCWVAASKRHRHREADEAGLPQTHHVRSHTSTSHLHQLVHLSTLLRLLLLMWTMMMTPTPAVPSAKQRSVTDLRHRQKHVGQYFILDISLRNFWSNPYSGVLDTKIVNSPVSGPSPVWYNKVAVLFSSDNFHQHV